MWWPRLALEGPDGMALKGPDGNLLPWLREDVPVRSYYKEALDLHWLKKAKLGFGWVRKTEFLSGRA
jgi:hypothetical protein